MSRVCPTVNRVRSQMKRASPALTLLRKREASCEPSPIKYSFPSHLASRPASQEGTGARVASPAVCLMRCGIAGGRGEERRGRRFRGENYNWWSPRSWSARRGKKETIEQLDRNV